MFIKGKTKRYGIVEGRQHVYVPEYYNLIRKNQQFKELQRRVKNGENIVVIDYDGPQDKNGTGKVLEVTPDMLRHEIQRLRQSFGHGFVVGAGLAGIKPQQYT